MNIQKGITAILFAVMVIASVLAVVPVVSATVTVYPEDRPGWESALVCDYREEFFTDATLNPGVSVETDNGYVETSTGVWWDRLVCPESGLTTTIWQFDTPLDSFGGNWNPGVPGDPGACIAVAIDGSWVSVGEIPAAYTGQFWGFTSTTSFSAVRLSPGSACNGAWCETYELDNMVYSFDDTTPPDISVTVSPDMLWPPNHKMVDIVAIVTVSDVCDATPSVVLTSITSDEPDNTHGTPWDAGDGNTDNDIQADNIGTEDYEFQLRAERCGTEDGRTYTITYTATDESGNSASASATVVVPHDMG